MLRSFPKIYHYFQKARKTLPYRILSAFIAFTFSFSYIVPSVPVYGQGIPAAVMNLSVPGTPVPLTPGFTPARIIGMTIHADNPLMFDFMVDPGDTGLDAGNGRDRSLQKESEQLIKYFLASLTVPAEKLWVNLSPYEKDKIVHEDFGQTEMGAELLAQDYMLKQLTASLMNPEDEVGRKFWDRVYEKAQKLFGTTEIPLNTFNKVWIVPEKAVVYVNGLNVFVLESRFKVMLEEDYLALEHHNAESPDPKADVVSGVSSSVIKEVLLPEIEKEVNEGRTFAKLRQIQNSLILATWYKQNLKESLLGQIYADKAMTGGLTVEDKEMSRKIYEQYVEVFKKGVHNFIKEDYDPATRQIIPRKYFSGGVKADPTKALKEETTPDGKELSTFADIGKNAQVFTAGIKSPDGNISSDMTFVPGGKKGEPSSPLGRREVSDLIKKLKDEDPFVRLKAAHALGGIGNPKAVAALTAALKDKHPDVRVTAAFALGRIGDLATVPVLIEALKDKYSSVRAAAAYALGEIGDRAAVPALTKAWKDKNRFVRQATLNAIKKIEQSESASSPLTDIQDAKKAIRSFFENRDMLPKVQIEKILGILKPIIEETRDEELGKIAGELEKRLLLEEAYLGEADITRLEGALNRLSSDTKGGIDLNPGNMDMQTNYGGDRIQLPMPDIPLESIRIDGLVPVILRVAPVASLPLLLGLKGDGATDEEGSDVFRVIDQQPAEAPHRFPVKEAEQVSALN